MTNPTMNDVPGILAAILAELQRLNTVQAQPVQPETPAAPEPEQIQDAEADAPTAPEQEAVTHDSLKALCLSLNRANAENKGIITGLIARFTTGKLADVPADKLADLHAAIQAECIHG